MLTETFTKFYVIVFLTARNNLNGDFQRDLSNI